eukprot:scaffold180_cov311-Pinguiococcus_pyrenoidosus.AAC.12
MRAGWSAAPPGASYTLPAARRHERHQPNSRCGVALPGNPPKGLSPAAAPEGLRWTLIWLLPAACAACRAPGRPELRDTRTSGRESWCPAHSRKRPSGTSRGGFRETIGEATEMGTATGTRFWSADAAASHASGCHAAPVDGRRGLGCSGIASSASQI